MDAPYQWAGKGKQAPELLVVLRRVIRHAKEWGVPTGLSSWMCARLLIVQESMGDMVAQRIGGLRPSGGERWGDALGGACVAGAAQAREMQVEVGDTVTSIPQSNGVRQRSPDSPVLFSRIVGDCLDHALHETRHLLRNPGEPSWMTPTSGPTAPPACKRHSQHWKDSWPNMVC